MERRMVPVTTADSTKAEEIEALDRMVASAQQGSYLHAFFTPELVARVQWAIQNDMNADVYGDVLWDVANERKTNEATRKEVLALRDQIEALHREHSAALAKADLRAKSALAEADRANDHCDALVKRNVSLSDKLRLMRLVVTDLWDTVETMMAKRDAADKRTERVLMAAARKFLGSF